MCSSLWGKRSCNQCVECPNEPTEQNVMALLAHLEASRSNMPKRRERQA